MLFIHGGGMIGGTRYDGLDQTLEWIDAVPMVVVSVEYRLAPNHPHPAPVDDCFAALQWMVSSATELGIDPARIAVSGASAGGGLAAAVALRARDAGSPTIAAQLLIYPMLDDRARHPSSVAYEAEGIHDRISNASCWAALLGEAAGTDSVSPYAAPARAESLAGLPPTFVDVGALETFRDEDVDYARRIWQDGGDAELHVWAGAFHGFDAIAPTATISRAAREARIGWLRRVLMGPDTNTRSAR